MIDSIFIIECCACGIEFGVSKSYDNNLRKKKQVFYCPNGHCQSYTKSTADRLAEDVEKKNAEIAGLKQQLADKDLAHQKEIKKMKLKVNDKKSNTGKKIASSLSANVQKVQK